MAIQIRPDLLRLLDDLLGAEHREIVSHAGGANPARFRFNRLKRDRPFQERLLALEGFGFRPVPEFPEACELVAEDSALGKSLAHFLGEIYIQDPASMLPTLILAPERDERVLDLCAAPGSKTTQLASMMGNQGVVVANDASGRRIRSLVFNLRRMGVLNTVVVKAFGEQYGNRYFEAFDAVLLDAPCSAVGTLRKSPEVLDWWRPERSERLAIRQRDLLRSGLKALRPGGRLVYSTCTLVPEENEAVIDSVLKGLPVELEEIAPPGLKARPGLTRFRDLRFDSGLRRAIRLYPHESGTEGFFVALLRKTGSFGHPRPDPTPEAFTRVPPVREDSSAEAVGQLASHFDLPESAFRGRFFTSGSELRCVSEELERFAVREKPIAIGLPVAHLKNPPARLTTEGSHLLGGHARRNVKGLANPEDLFRFVNRDTLAIKETAKGQVLVAFEGAVAGHALADSGRLLSRFPRAGWTFGPASGGGR